MVINKIALRGPGGVQRGQAPSGGGLGVSPRFPKTPLGRVGGKACPPQAGTTPMFRRPRRRRPRAQGVTSAPEQLPGRMSGQSDARFMSKLFGLRP